MTQTLERGTLPAESSHRRRRWIRPVAVGAVVILFAIELVVGWSALVGALHQLRTPRLGWLALVVLAELAAMSAYARMQRHLLRSAGVTSSYRDNIRITYAAHSLNETLPGGPAFSTRLNFRQLRRLGAGPAVASWVIALSGILSTTALAAITAWAAFASGDATHWARLTALLAVAVLIVFGVRHFTAKPEKIDTLIRRPLATVNRLRKHPESEGRERVASFMRQLRAARLRPAHGFAAVAYALLNWLLDAVGLWLCFYAVGGHPPDSTAVVLAFGAAMAAGSVTVVPGGLGVIDSALVLGLVVSGATVPTAVAVVVLYRLVSFGFIIGLGWLSWLQLRRRPAPVVRAVTPGSRPRTNLRLLAGCPHQTRSNRLSVPVQRRRAKRAAEALPK